MDVALVIQLVAQAIHDRWPNRPDRRVSLGDACSRTTDCSGHPPGAHGIAAQTIDIDYYTLGKSNHIQFGSPRVEIYQDTATCDDLDLLETVFDWERNYWMFKLLKQAFPAATFGVGEDIRDYMTVQIMAKYGVSERNTFVLMTSGDPGCAYNHHLHTHAYLGGEINGQADVSGW